MLQSVKAAFVKMDAVPQLLMIYAESQENEYWQVKSRETIVVVMDRK